MDCREKACTAEDLAAILNPVASKGIPTRPASAALDIKFKYSSAQIDPEYKANLDALGKALQNLSAPSVEIAGHTDSVGSKPLNQTLSQRRAESVKQYLVQKFHLPPDRLVAKGYGQDKPIIAPDTTPEAREKNRRVEVVRPGQ